MTYAFVKTFGSYGTAWGQVKNLSNILARDGTNIYTSEYSIVRIQLWNYAGANFKGRYNVTGCGYGQARMIGGMCFDPDGSIWFLDENCPLIIHCNSLMIPISSFTPVVGPGQYLSRASGLAIDSAGNFYITDRQMHKVHVFSRAGVWLRCWGGPGSDDGLFNQPRGIFVDQYDNVYVADCLNGRIQKFTSSGTFLLKFGSSSPGNSYLSSPYCVMVDLNDDVFVADFYGAAVKVFSNQGVYKDRVGTSGWRPGSTERPSSVYSDSMGTVHIADYSLAWIAQFRWALAPISNFTALPLTGLPPLSVQFTDTSQNYPTSWLWSFGDGGTSTLKNPLHFYLDEGLYSVGLKVTNAIGYNTTIKTDYILVEVPVPETPRFKPLWSLQIGPV